MSKFIKRATITVNALAKAYFPDNLIIDRREADVIAELQEVLQNEGDDPRYTRAVFAVEGKDRFAEINEGSVILAGIFPRHSHIYYPYGSGYVGLKNVLSKNNRDTLVVVDTENMAKMWDSELKGIGYKTRRI